MGSTITPRSGRCSEEREINSFYTSAPGWRGGSMIHCFQESVKRQTNKSLKQSINNKKRRKATCQERWRYAVSARSPVSSCRAEAVLVAGSFHLEERLRQYFCEAQILHLPSVRSMIFSRHLHGLAAGWMRHVPLQTSFWIVSAMSGRCLRLALP
ncbi:hypothetical protein TcCL_NonESM11835, partial [Trypanosoma cruzi]